MQPHSHSCSECGSVSEPCQCNTTDYICPECLARMKKQPIMEIFGEASEVLKGVRELWSKTKKNLGLYPRFCWFDNP